jgi:hypothetical protein
VARGARAPSVCLQQLVSFFASISCSALAVGILNLCCILSFDSSDAAIRNQLIIYIRFFDPVTKKLREEYLGIVALRAGDAKTIDDALCAYLELCNLSLLKCVAFGSDGAGTMVGCNKGVATSFT